MDSGIHAQVAVRGIKTCPVATISEEFEVTSVFTDRQTMGEGGGIVGELTIDHAAKTNAVPEQATRVFSDDSQSVYRFTNQTGDCPCGRIPDHGCPVREIHTDAGTLCVSFLTPDVETLQSIIADLRLHCTSVRVRRLTHSTPDERQALLFVDRTAFTDRQYEVLQTAHKMGYFAHPKEADSADVANELGISVATLSEHLAVTQQKLLDQLLTA